MALSDVCFDFANNVESICQRFAFAEITRSEVEEFKQQVYYYENISDQPGACKYDPNIIKAIIRVVDKCFENNRWFYAIVSLKMITIQYNIPPGAPECKTDEQLVSWLNATYDMM